MQVQFPAAALITPNRSTPAADPIAAGSAESGTFHEVLAQASSPSKKPDKLTDVAKQFEALMIGQVLKAARESSDGGWLSNDDDQTGELTLEMAEQGFAQAMANRGVLGIAKLVTDTLQRHSSTTANSGPAPSHLPAPSNTDSSR